VNDAFLDFPKLLRTPPETMLPSRREIKDSLSSHATKESLTRALIRWSFDYLVWLFALGVIVTPTPLVAKCLASVVMALWAIRLFVIGHDACHGSYTSFPALNRWLGRLALLPALTPFSVWEVGHNVAHHGYNNLKAYDFVWAPLSPSEYCALSPFKKAVYRVYRSGWAPGVYYITEIWWKKLLFLNSEQLQSRRKLFVRDKALVLAFCAGWLGLLIFGADHSGQSPLQAVLLGFVAPFFVWSSASGFAVFVQHTHPSVRWYEDKVRWGADRAHLTATVHVQLPAGLGVFFHSILDHTAHHVDMSIPLTNLPAAQATLREQFGAEVRTQPFSWNWYFQTARSCQLYDYGAQRWSALPGRASAAGTCTPEQPAATP
jgi:acyl-lipid omega-6 desaturase (Delta-12 desaturase)